MTKVRAFTFPGQGSQAVGMGAELAAAFGTARQVFEEVDEALKQKLSEVMFKGPESELTLTANAQPALMALSVAGVRVLERDGRIDLPNVARLVAGHSLGEYSALVAAGALQLGDAARLLRRRGVAMQAAVPLGEGAMAALLGLDLAAAREVAEGASKGPNGFEVCATANDNAPGQVVVSGARAAVERAIEIAKTKGAKRAILLPVSAPFHCPLMKPAAEAMAEALSQVTLAPPRVPLVANVTARATSDPATIKKLLVEQVTSLVRWRECIQYIKAQGVAEVVEIGAGKVLTGLAKRIEPELAALSIQGPAEIEAFLKTL